MDRRGFLKSSVAATALAATGGVPGLAFAANTVGAWRKAEVTFAVTPQWGDRAGKVWLPAPMDTSFQRVLGITWESGPDRIGLNADEIYRAPAIAAEWAAGKPREVRATYVVETIDRQVNLKSAPKGGRIDDDVRVFLQPTATMPVDGIVRETALKITKGATQPVDKARAIYEWIVENCFRDPKTKGCGIGDIKYMLVSGNLGGKCADINSLFVGLTRAAGVPAREMFGIRTADSATLKSLGRAGDISKAQHCRAEFWTAGLGWVPVDPADVRKAVLEESLPLTDPKISALRKKLFGAWEMNWMAFNVGRDFRLPPSGSAPINFFMYPEAEVKGADLDGTDPDSFAYKIVSKVV